MSNIPALYKEEENKRRGLVISFVVHTLLLIFLIVPFLNPMKQWPPEEGGILVVFGDQNAGNGLNPSEPAEQPVNTTEKKVPSTEAIAVNNPTSKVKEEDSPVIASKAKTEAQKKAEAEAKAKTQREKEEKEKADKAAKEKAESEQAKKQFSDLFGSGKGNSGTTGNQGDPKGDPDGKVLEGISTGSGQIGGGLSGRGVLFEPVFRDNSQKTGRVVLNICVDSEGKVISASFTQKGSTTSDALLIDIARSNALKYKFSKSDIDKQCGSLTVDFRLK